MVSKKTPVNWNRQSIKALRHHLKLTQAKLGRELGTRQQTISEWETGMYEPRGTSVTILNIIAERSNFKYNPNRNTEPAE